MKLLLLCSALMLAACTPGASIGSNGGGGGSAMTVDVNLTLHQDGYLPDTLTVPVGTMIRFKNSDGFTHTATLIPGAASFPAGSPFNVSALSRSGSTISSPWTSGTLQPGSFSQTLTVDRAGTYLFGCFFHYGAPMRGTIIAQ